MTVQEESKAKQKLREQAEKLKNDAQKENKNMSENKEEKALAVGTMSAIEQNEELAKLYNDNSKVGAENLAGQLPLLKIQAAGRSTTNELIDGSEPKDGYFFYKPTQEQFSSIRCHILTISRGFRTEKINKKPGQKDTFNQIIAGVILNDNSFKPFVMFITGKRLSSMWEFGKEAGKYTRMKPVSIPMFALTVDLSTHKEKVVVENMSTNVHVIDFNIVKNKVGSPIVVTDTGEFQYLRDSVASMNDMIEQVINSKAIDEDNAEDIKVQEEAEAVFKGEEVNTKDVPF